MCDHKRTKCDGRVNCWTCFFRPQCSAAHTYPLDCPNYVCRECRESMLTCQVSSKRQLLDALQAAKKLFDYGVMTIRLANSKCVYRVNTEPSCLELTRRRVNKTPKHCFE